MPGTAPPTAPPRPSVVTVRMSPELHEQLKAAAHRERLSMNQFCVRQLRKATWDLASRGSEVPHA